MKRALSLTLALLSGLASQITLAQSSAYERMMWDAEASLQGNRYCRGLLMVRCWYVFHTINESPVRQVWLLDLKARSPENSNRDLVELDVIKVHESDDPATSGAYDLEVQTVQFQCSQKLMRVSRGDALQFTGVLDRTESPSPWSAYGDNPYSIAAKAACEKPMRMRPEASGLMWLGDFYRPIDVADLTRHLLWGQN